MKSAIKTKAPDKNILKYYAVLLKSFKRNRDEARKDMYAGAIHNLRVDIKKINALYRFLELSFPDEISADKYGKPFSKLFKCAGELREIQIANTELHTIGLSKKAAKIFIQALRKKNKKAEHALRASIDRMKNIRANDKRITALCKRLDVKTFKDKSRHFMVYECNKLRRIMQKPAERKNIHKVRKCVKDFDYGLRLINRVVPNKEYGYCMNELKETGELIGKWHDRITLKRLFKKMRTDNLKPATHDFIEAGKIINAAYRNDAEFLPALKRKTARIQALANGFV